MTVQVNWLKPDRIVEITVSGIFTGDEVQTMDNTLHEYLSIGTKPVHLMFDIRQMEKYPTNLRQLISSAGYLRHSARGHVVVVGGGSIVDFITTVISQTIKFPLTRVATPDDAIKFLRKRDTTLDDVSPA